MFVNVVLRSAMEIKDFYTWEANDKKQSKFPSFPFSFYANQIITPSLSSMDSANRDRVEGFQPIVIEWKDFSLSWNPYTPYCFSIVESYVEKLKENMDKSCP